MIFDLLLLSMLPVAAWAGWQFARISSRRGERKRSRLINNRYFQGLNYLLNEQPDKAIQVFLQMAEVNKDTIETHLALGSLFRRRGEVDRAIRLHQNIISKRNLDDKQRTLALLELGEDYMRAGLFDRAERLFSDLIERGAHTPAALRSLLDIYQQEKDWERALEIGARLDKLEPQGLGTDMSHFCCELAEAALAEGVPETARKYLRQARRFDPESVRAEMIGAQIARQAGDAEQAMRSYERIAELDSRYLPDILEPYFETAATSGQQERAQQALQRWAESYDGVSLLLKQAQLVAAAEGDQAAAECLSKQLAKRPSVRGLHRLLAWRNGGQPGEGTEAERILVAVTSGLLASQPAYRCHHCGFSGNQHHWLCPSCKQWGTTRIIRGVLGE